jgi:hypothetical protein
MNDGSLFVDGHVHLYQRGDVQDMFSAVSENFARAANRARTSVSYGILLLADPQSIDGFHWCSQLSRLDGSKQSTGWKIVSKPDNHTLHVSKKGCIPLAVLGGHQAITEEGLEVLIFPKKVETDERQPTRSLITRTIEAGGLAILPWGAGKWLGRRGKLIEQVIGDTAPGQLAIADNGGRPRVWRTVSILATARQRRFQIMSGTDPLPIPGELQRVGSYGFSLTGSMDSSWNSSDIISALCTRELRPYGRLLPLWDFLRKQVALRV